MSLNTFSPAEILVLVGGAILPAPAVPASTGMSSRLERVQEHSSRVIIVLRRVVAGAHLGTRALLGMGLAGKLSHAA